MFELLPSNEKGWIELTAGKSFKDKTIHSFESPDSGSKITLPQFLLLRVLWVKQEAATLSKSSEYGRWGISKKNLDIARKHLAKLSDWGKYKSTFYNNLAWHQETGYFSLGTFSLVRLYQLNSKSITRSDYEFTPKLEFSPRKTRSQRLAGRSRPNDGIPVTPTRSQKRDPLHDAESALDGLSLDDDEVPSPETDIHISPFSPPNADLPHNLQSISDEKIVNMALLLYLQALLINFRGIGADWTPERRALIVKNNNGQKVYEARVDGFLRYQNDTTNPIMAIVEVKPCIRDAHSLTDPIRMQEGAQMAAWICQHPPSPSELNSDQKFSRLLVSQDRESIYVTFAEFNSSYLRYIRESPPVSTLSKPLDNHKSTGSNFLKMNEYGPFDIGTDNHMSSLGLILLAFCIGACEAKAEGLSKAQKQSKR